jgi:hypothetical protein
MRRGEPFHEGAVISCGHAHRRMQHNRHPRLVVRRAPIALQDASVRRGEARRRPDQRRREVRHDAMPSRFSWRVDCASAGASPGFSVRPSV